jgi:hypothetical protein
METWLEVPGFEGAYAASDHGRVRSLDHEVNAPQNGGMRTVRGKLLVAIPSPKGYLMVSLGRGNRYFVHQLVALTFIGPCPSGSVVRHGPRGKTYNRPSNLSYGTRAENNADAAWDKQNESPHGLQHHNAKLTPELVKKLRSEYTPGLVSYQNLADKYGMSLRAVYAAITRETWAHVA